MIIASVRTRIRLVVASVRLIHQIHVIHFCYYSFVGSLPSNNTTSSAIPFTRCSQPGATIRTLARLPSGMKI